MLGVRAGIDRVNRSAHELQRLGHLAPSLCAVEVREAGQPDVLALHTLGFSCVLNLLDFWEPRIVCQQTL